MFEEFDIKETEGKLLVHAKLYSAAAAGKKLKAQTQHIISMLVEKGVEFYDCVKENVLHNGAEHARMGTWVFKSKPTPLVKKEVVVETTAKVVEVTAKKTKRIPKFKNKI